MSYETIVTALRERIAGGELDKLDPSCITEGDYTVFNESHYYYVVLDYSGFDRQRMALEGQWSIVWHLQALCAVAYDTDVQVHEDLRALRDEIIERISIKPGLGIDAFDAGVIRGEDVPEMLEAGSGLTLSAEVLFIDVVEIQDYDEED